MKKGLTVLQKTSRKDLVVEHLMETKNIAICSKWFFVSLTAKNASFSIIPMFFCAFKANGQASVTAV